MNHQSGDIDIIKKIDAYLKNQLSEKEAEDFWVELLKNPEYIELLETELAIKSILHDRQKQTQGDSPQAIPASANSNTWKWIGAAASVVVLVVAINFLRVETTSLQQQTIGNINMTNQLAAPMVMRSEGDELTGADSLMNIGFEAALSGDENRALEIYQQVVDRYEQGPAAAQAYLNMGIIKYNSSEYREASSAFDEALVRIEQDRVLQEKAYWYLGNAYTKLNQLEQAKQAIQNAYALDGTYRKSAFRLLRKIDYELGNLNMAEIDQQTEGS